MINISLVIPFEKFVEISKKILPHWREYEFNKKQNAECVLITDSVYENVYTFSYNCKTGLAHFYALNLNDVDRNKMLEELVKF